MLTRTPIETQSILRACIRSVALVESDGSGATFWTEAVVESKRQVSSADLSARTGPAGSTVTGRLRIDAISDHILRVRYAEGDVVPAGITTLVVGNPTPPTSLDMQTTADSVTIQTGALRTNLRLDNGRIAISHRDGRPLLGVGGPEENNFRRWDSHNTGLVRALDGDAQLAVESFDLVPGECIYGFGEKFIQLDKVGQTIDLMMDDAIGVISPRSYKNVPFYVSTHGYGVFFNHHSLMTAWVGSMSAVDVQVAIADDHLDYYIIVGSIKEVLARYTELTGKSPMPPEWSFGLWQSKSTYVSAEETLEIARELRRHDIPCNVINVDTAWFEEDWLCGLEFGPAFPDPAAWIADLGELGFKVSLWQTPYLPEGTRLFAELADIGGFVKNVRGGTYDIGICFTPGFKGVVGVIDFTNPAAVAIYQKYLRAVFRLGVSVFKTDFGEQAPLDGIYHDGTPGVQMRNRYPLLYNAAVTAVAKEETGFPFVWSRSTWAGGQRFPVHWGGDSSPLWSNLIPQIAGGLSLGLSGFTFWSHDIGGFFGDKDDEALLIRWLQAGVFCSHPRIHGMGKQELYKFSPGVLKIGREFIKLRYQLMPYVLEQAKTSAAAGLPMMRPLVVEFQDDPNTWHIADEFLFGDSLLVAPVYNEAGERRVYLPAGGWIDWWTKDRLEGGRWINVKAPIEIIPLYQREGTEIPLAAV
jgi:alpha-D-xyloside xylohydrolase